MRRVLLILTAALVLAGCTPGQESPDPGPTGAQEDVEPAPDPAAQAGPGTGVQLFQWTWDAIGRECEEVLGPAGYGWVLTSPPQEHILGEEWWTAYQPVSYLVESRLGTRDQFASMVATCEQAGVAVIADAVINHMTGQDDPGVGWAGSPYEHYEYPGIWSDEEGDFHHCGLTPNDDILTYQDREQVQTCELLNLADLATGTERVQARLAEYLEDLLSLGVAGFRIDAAKHMATEDVGAIVGRLPEDTFIMQEVIGAPAEPITPEEYLPNGAVFDFFYGRDLQAYVRGGSVDRVLGLGSGSRALPGEQALVFVDNHDTERNRSTLSYKFEEEYEIANVLMLAGDYGTPVVYSGYAFLMRDTGPDQDDEGRVVDAECVADPGPGQQYDLREWVCQHRWPAILGMVGWRKAVGEADIDAVWTGRRAVAFSRGDRGFVAVNGGPVELAEENVPTTLPPGRYCDVAAGPPTAAGCAGDVVEVQQDGTVQLSMGPRTAMALHVEALAD